MVKHNNVLPNGHFHKDWQRRVRTWFDQPGRKLCRRQARKTKVAALGVRPLKPLRPAVRRAGIGRKAARGLGIVVDHRRRNLSEEGKKLNVERLVDYRKRLIVFPKKANKPKKGDSTGAELQAATTRLPPPLPAPYVHEVPRKITGDEREFKAYRALRDARAIARHDGMRKIRAAKKEEEEAAKKK
ncbi:ribosomal protein L13e [Gautieria morchelliformis]|nr:ribosomal protein L13e [Gautieria morchelliformis]